MIFHSGERALPSRPKSTDEILEELLQDTGPERLLCGHEIIRMVYAGRIPPGEYHYETEYVDGRIQIETFRADKNGNIRNLKIWIENPDTAKSKSRKRNGKAHRSRTKLDAKQRTGKHS